MTPSKPFVIVGGGISGLAAAYELHRRGASVVVLERGWRPGGLILTEQIEGFTIDAGPDSLLVQKPAAIHLCQELGLGDRLTPTSPPRTAFILRAGRLHPLPEASVLGIPTRIAPLAATRLFSWPGKLRMAMELVVPRHPSPYAEDESIGAFMRRRFGREAVDYLAEPLLAGIHAGDVDELSMRSAFPRLQEAENRHGSVLRAFRALSSHRSSDGIFRSLPGGLGELVDALVDSLPPATIRYGASVSAVEPARSGPPSAAGLRVVLESGEIVPARAVLLAVPAYVAADLLAPIDCALAELCRDILYVSTMTVALGYRRESVGHPLNGSGFVVPRVEPGTRLMAASWVSSKWRHRAPAGHVLLRAFFGGVRNPELLSWDERDVIELAHRELARLLNIANRPVLARAYRWIRGNAQHVVGHLDRVAAVERRLAAWPGLFVTGSAFRGTGIPDCVEDGRLVGTRAFEYVATLAR